MNWATCIDRYDQSHTLVYLYPQYHETQGYGVPFPFAKYERWQGDCGVSRGGAIASLNDHADIRRVFDGFFIETMPIQ